MLFIQSYLFGLIQIVERMWLMYLPMAEIDTESFFLNTIVN